MTLVMGIDGGGTRTVAAVLDDTLRELGRGQGGPANYHNVGLESVQEALRTAAQGACREAGCRLDELSALGCGLAGAGRTEDRDVLRQAVAEALPILSLILSHDAEIALVGGTGRREGVLVICGTGSMAYGVNAAGVSARAGGWGPILDDRGSGFWIGRCALRSAVRGYERRGPPTALGAEILQALALSRMDDLIRWASTKGSVQEIAGLAPWVGRCAQAGDHVAQRILRRAGRELASLVEAVLRQLDMADMACEVVLAGGTLRHQPLVREALCEGLGRLAPRARLIWPRHEPVVGAALLALMELEVDERDPN
jgi:N-acetylglucosamine kinase-like BadF-type ATPase